MSTASDAASKAGDAVLWQEVRRGDGRSFALLHRRHVDRVYRHCYARLQAPDEAESVVNQTFLTAWQKRHELSVSESGLLPWLLVTAANICMATARSRRRRTRLLVRVGRPEVAPNDDDAVHDRVVSQQHAGVLRAALRKLPDSSQQILWLCEVEQLSTAEVARLLSIPEGTVKSRRSRARRTLREFMSASAEYTDRTAEGRT